jgi:hypothetical protein
LGDVMEGGMESRHATRREVGIPDAEECVAKRVRQAYGPDRRVRAVAAQQPE